MEIRWPHWSDYGAPYATVSVTLYNAPSKQSFISPCIHFVLTCRFVCRASCRHKRPDAFPLWRDDLQTLKRCEASTRAKKSARPGERKAGATVWEWKAAEEHKTSADWTTRFPAASFQARHPACKTFQQK